MTGTFKWVVVWVVVSLASMASVAEDASKTKLRFALARDGAATSENWKADPQIADFNGDGHLDIAGHPRLGKGTRVWLGNGKMEWREVLGNFRRSGPCGGGLRVADLNADGHLDIAVADHCRGVFIYLGDGSGTNWEVAVSELAPPEEHRTVGSKVYIGVEDLDIGDVNSDGHLDLVVGGADTGGVNTWLGDGSGRNWTFERESLPENGWANGIHVEDLNDDGHLDIIAAHEIGPRVWHGDGKGRWTEASIGLPKPPIGGLFRALDVADVNDDGLKDILVANWVEGPEVHIQQPDRTWRRLNQVFDVEGEFPELRGGSTGVEFADFNHDGRPDIICTGRLVFEEVGFVYGTFILINEGDGKFVWQRDNNMISRGLPFTWHVSVADLNKDNVLDVVVASGGKVATSQVSLSPAIPAGLVIYKGREDR